MQNAHVLKPHDLIIPLKFLAIAGAKKTYRELGESLHISIGEISEAIKRLEYSKLIHRNESVVINRRALLDFVICGVPYVFPTIKGLKKRGVPTAYNAHPLNKAISQNSELVVWEAKDGNSIGYSIDPLYANAPLAALKDERLYVLLSLIDAIRLGEARSYKLAKKYLEEIIINNDWSLKSEYEL